MKRRRAPSRREEDEIQIAVADHLRFRGKPGLVWFHVPNGAYFGASERARAIQGKRLKDFGVRAGVSDVVCLYQGRFYALELKAPKGKPPTAEQMEFTSDVNAAGGFASVASGVDQALRILETWNLLIGKTEYSVT